jgi:hypothetical protein
MACTSIVLLSETIHTILGKSVALDRGKEKEVG